MPGTNYTLRHRRGPAVHESEETPAFPFVCAFPPSFLRGVSLVDSSAFLVGCGVGPIYSTNLIFIYEVSTE